MDERHVLVVEDDEAIRGLVELIASRHGYTSSLVTDGGEAIAALAGETTYDAVILDLMMPNVSGYDVIRYIKENSLPVPVIVVTAAIKGLDWTRIDKSVVKAVLTKPFEIEALTGALTAVCGAPHSR
ncbi:MAG TPA: response regulator [Thermoanaerobaculia bacterium]|nr:response regulator [Thermoanaerobaculia bacterium]